MRKNVYLFILLFCTMFLFACSNSEEASIMKIQNILLSSEEVESNGEVLEETVEPEEGETEEVLPEEEKPEICDKHKGHKGHKGDKPGKGEKPSQEETVEPEEGETEEVLPEEVL